MLRKNYFIFEQADHKASGVDNLRLVLTLNKNMESLGYSFDAKAVEALRYTRVGYLTELWQFLLPILKQKTGANRAWRAFYPNFPSQVMEASDFELYLNAIIHYWTRDALIPYYIKDERLPLFETGKVQYVSIATEQDFNEMMANVIMSNTSISETDKGHIALISENLQAFEDVMSLVTKIPQKETLAFVTSLAMENGIDMSLFYKTTTDVLRLAVAMSDGDVSLAKNTKFRSFSRGQRRYLLGLLDSIIARDIESAEMDMALHVDKWIRLGERLHPSEYYQFPYATSIYHYLRNEKLQTFHSKVQKAIDSGNLGLALNLLSERAGEFARRLDFLFRNFPKSSKAIADAFYSVSHKVSTPVLLQVMGHFTGRDFNSVRSFLPKGNLAKLKVIPNNLPEMEWEVVDAVANIVWDELVQRFSKLGKLGKVYIDSELKNYLIPSSQRSASEAIRPVTKGSRFPINTEKNTIRAFIQWKNVETEYGHEEYTDIDLSVSFYDDEWKSRGDVAYTNLRTNGAWHSGDFRNAPRPHGVAEFLDLDIEKLSERGIRYALFSVYSFSRQPFSSMDCIFGWMEREHVQSGEIFEPSTVQHKLGLSGDSQNSLPVMFDLQEKCFIWMDLAMNVNELRARNVHNNKYSMKELAQAMSEFHLSKLSLYDLFMAHVEGRGELVANREDADFVFGLEDGDVNAFDLEVIASNYMS